MQADVATTRQSLKTATLKHLVLLQLAVRGPSHGYAIAKSLEELIPGWRPSLGTLYRVMDELERDGYIECRREPGGRQKKVCSITSQGIHYLVSRITTQMKYIAYFYKLIADAIDCIKESTTREERLVLLEHAERMKKAVEKIIKAVTEPTPSQA